MKPHTCRHYDPSNARFISEDPIGFNGGDLNLYRYVSNNPISLTDPSGLTAKDILEAWKIARRINPNLPENITFMTSDMGQVNGLTLSPINTIVLNERYLENLSYSQKFYLLQTIIHESMHFSDGFYDTFFHPRHEEIYQKSNEFTYKYWREFLNNTSNQCSLHGNRK